MLCLSTSEQEIEDALGNMKATFCNNAAVTDETANREQCVKALKTAVETLAKIKKDGKRTLNKDENIDLKKEIVDAYKELTRLQGYSGLDKAQKCFEFAEKWRYETNPVDH
jgi:LAS superfamily LD-carboxypeptidase LdcB